MPQKKNSHYHNKPNAQELNVRKKVLLTTPTFPPFNSGLGNAAFNQALFLKSHGFDVTIATYGDSRLGTIDENGIRVERFNIYGARYIFNPIRGDIDAYKQYLLSSRFDLVICNAWQIWSTDLVLENADKIHGKKIIYSHCTSLNIILRGKLVRSLVACAVWLPYRLRLRKHLKAINGIIFLSEGGCQDRFLDYQLCKRIKMEHAVIPNTATCEAQPANIEGRAGIISVGSYDWLKGHDLVLKAYAKSKFKNVEKITFYGQRDSPFLSSLRKQASRAGILDDYIDFKTGCQGAELIKAYSKSKLFISASRTECQPLVLIDAIMTRTPFLTSNVGSVVNFKSATIFNSTKELVRILNKINLDDYFIAMQPALEEDSRTHNYSRVEKKFVDYANSVLALPDQ